MMPPVNFVNGFNTFETMLGLGQLILLQRWRWQKQITPQHHLLRIHAQALTPLDRLIKSGRSQYPVKRTSWKP